MIRGIGGWRLLPALALLMAVAGPAQAHTLSESHSLWEIRGTDVDLVMTIPVLELQRLGAGGAAPSDEAVKGYLAARVYPIAAGRRCALVPPVETLSAAPGYRKYDFTFRCPVAGDLHDAALAAMPDCPELRLWTLEANHRARRFYERRGWRLNGMTRIVPYPPNPLDVGYLLVREEP